MNVSQSNLISAASSLSKQLSAKVTHRSLRKVIEENPYYPSLLSLSEAFNRFNIPNQSFALLPQQMEELEAPFIALWKKDFVAVTQKGKSTVTYHDFNGKVTTTSLESFLKNYNNVVFVAEPNEHSGEPGYENISQKEKKRKTKKIFLYSATIVGALLLLTPFYLSLLDSQFNPGISIFGAAKIIGLISSVLLLTYEFDKSNKIVKNICSAGKQTNCEAVLNSKASRIFGISWSEMGFYYFGATAIFLFSPLPVVFKVPYITVASILVAPYVLFSIYYQWRIIKHWCPLCLIVQFAIFLELVAASGTNWNSEYSVVIESRVLLTLSISVLLPIIGLNWVKPLFLKLKKIDGYEAAYKRLLYNPELFSALLQQQPIAPEGWQNMGITLGNREAKNSILKVCNPFCGPCANAHPILEEIIRRNSDYNLKVIFTSTNNPNDQGGAVARHLIAIDNLQSEEKIQQALDDWYLSEKKDYQKLATKYPMNGELNESKKRLEAMGEWCKEANIRFTPTIFINGKQLPEPYGIAELKNIL